MPIPNMPSQQLQTRVSKIDTFSPVSSESQPLSKLGSLLGSLNEVLPAVANQASKYWGAEVEKDKTKQEALALTNQLPSKDATVAGLQAHKNVNTRNDVALAITSLEAESTEWEESRDGSWEEHFLATQDALVQKHGESEADIEFVGSLFREQLPRVQEARFKTVQKQDQVAKYHTARESFVAGANSRQYTPEQISQNVTQILVDEGDKLGMTTEARRTAFIDATVAAAENDDLALMEVAKELGLYAQEPGLITAERAAVGRMAGDQQAYLASAVSNVETELKNNPAMSRDTFFRKMGEVKTREGKAVVSRKEMVAAWERGNKVLDEKFQAQSLFQESMGRLTDETKNPVAFGVYTKKEQQAVINQYNDWADKRTTQKLATIQENDFEAQNKVHYEADVLKGTYLNETGLTDETWKAEFSLVQNSFDPETMEGKTLPPAVASALVSMNNLKDKPFALKRHASEEAIAISTEYQRNLAKNYNEVQALSMAQKSILAPKRLLGADDKKTFSKDVRSVVDSHLSSSLWRWGSVDMKVSQSAQVYNEVMANAERKFNLTGDSDGSIADSMAEYNDSHWQLGDGRILPGSRQEIGRAMGIPANKLDEVDDKIIGFPQVIMDRLEAAGEVPETPYPPEEWIPFIKGNRITYTDKYGAPIGTYNLNELNNISNAELAKQLATESKELSEKRKKKLIEDSRTKALQAKFAESMLK
jgi:hypothetical protein